MAIKDRLLNQYVVFMKATTAVWEKMADADKKANTLYFVVDGDNDDVGQLYLGSTLVADGSGLSEVKMDMLEDVSIAGNISGGDILMYDINSMRWVNVPLNSKIGDLIKVFVGATTEKNGSSGLVPAPTISDIDKYLKGDGSWGDPTKQVREDLAGLTATVATLVDQDAGKSVRSIATELAQRAASEAVTRIVAQAPESFDTLQEIAKWIADHPETADITALQNRVTKLETTVGDESGGLVHSVANLTTTVNSFTSTLASVEAKANTLESNLGALTGQFTTLSNTVTSHGTSITEIREMLTWRELYEE